MEPNFLNLEILEIKKKSRKKTFSSFFLAFYALMTENWGNCQIHAGHRRCSLKCTLLHQDAHVLFNAIFLCCLPEGKCNALVDRCDIKPCELAASADLLLHTTPALVAAATLEFLLLTTAPSLPLLPHGHCSFYPPFVANVHNVTPITATTTSFIATLLLPL
jgi:hypothetical protein